MLFKYIAGINPFQCKLCITIFTQHYRSCIYFYFNFQIFGFANCMLWISSLWFIYKETSFHQQIPPPGMMPQMGQQQQAPPMQEQDLKMGGQYEY